MGSPAPARGVGTGGGTPRPRRLRLGEPRRRRCRPDPRFRSRHRARLGPVGPAAARRDDVWRGAAPPSRTSSRDAAPSRDPQALGWVGVGKADCGFPGSRAVPRMKDAGGSRAAKLRVEISSPRGTREPAALEKNQEAPGSRRHGPRWPFGGRPRGNLRTLSPWPQHTVHHEGTSQHPRSLQGGRLDLRRPSGRVLTLPLPAPGAHPAKVAYRLGCR